MQEKGKKRPVLLVICDGFGHNASPNGNAVYHAHMPFYKSALTSYPSMLLHASGTYVGLPQGFMGNSQVGHRTIGCGKVITTTLKKFHDAIDNDTFKNNVVLKNTLQTIKSHGTSLHMAGLVSDAGVHSHMRHIQAYIEQAVNTEIKNIYIHAFLDGRDTAPKSAKVYLDRLSTMLNKYPNCHLASIHGRFYAMDRDNNWSRTQQSYEVLFSPNAKQTFSDYHRALEHNYNAGITDEFLPPLRLRQDGQIQDSDGIIFFNFRADRMRQLVQATVDPEFDKFTRGPIINLCATQTTSPLDDRFKKWECVHTFEHESVSSTLLDVVSSQIDDPKALFTIAETEKYAHVTWFFRGNREVVFENETQVMIPSLKEKNYVQHPEMSAPHITQAIVDSLENDPHHLYVINYANADMVGHSADMGATVKACEVLDEQLKRLHEVCVQKMDGTLIITSDHGKAEELIDEQGWPKTAHTKNMVPLVVITNDTSSIKLPHPGSGLSSVARLVLMQLGLQAPSEMD